MIMTLSHMSEAELFSGNAASLAGIRSTSKFRVADLQAQPYKLDEPNTEATANNAYSSALFSRKETFEFDSEVPRVVEEPGSLTPNVRNALKCAQTESTIQTIIFFCLSFLLLLLIRENWSTGDLHWTVRLLKVFIKTGVVSVFFSITIFAFQYFKPISCPPYRSLLARDDPPKEKASVLYLTIEEQANNYRLTSSNGNRSFHYEFWKYIYSWFKGFFTGVHVLRGRNGSDLGILKRGPVKIENGQVFRIYETETYLANLHKYDYNINNDTSQFSNTTQYIKPYNNPSTTNTNRVNTPKTNISAVSLINQDRTNRHYPTDETPSSYTKFNSSITHISQSLWLTSINLYIIALLLTTYLYILSFILYPLLPEPTNDPQIPVWIESHIFYLDTQRSMTSYFRSIPIIHTWVIYAAFTVAFNSLDLTWTFGNEPHSFPRARSWKKLFYRTIIGSMVCQGVLFIFPALRLILRIFLYIPETLSIYLDRILETNTDEIRFMYDGFLALCCFCLSLYCWEIHGQGIKISGSSVIRCVESILKRNTLSIDDEIVFAQFVVDGSWVDYLRNHQDVNTDNISNFLVKTKNFVFLIYHAIGNLKTKLISLIKPIRLTHFDLIDTSIVSSDTTSSYQLFDHANSSCMTDGKDLEIVTRYWELCEEAAVRMHAGIRCVNKRVGGRKASEEVIVHSNLLDENTLIITEELNDNTNYSNNTLLAFNNYKPNSSSSSSVLLKSTTDNRFSNSVVGNHSAVVGNHSSRFHLIARKKWLIPNDTKKYNKNNIKTNNVNNSINYYNQLINTIWKNDILIAISQTTDIHPPTRFIGNTTNSILFDLGFLPQKNHNNIPNNTSLTIISSNSESALSPEILFFRLNALTRLATTYLTGLNRLLHSNYGSKVLSCQRLKNFIETLETICTEIREVEKILPSPRRKSVYSLISSRELSRLWWRGTQSISSIYGSTVRGRSADLIPYNSHMSYFKRLLPYFLQEAAKTVEELKRQEKLIIIERVDGQSLIPVDSKVVQSRGSIIPTLNLG